jgi:hypothetical protein
MLYYIAYLPTGDMSMLENSLVHNGQRSGASGEHPSEHGRTLGEHWSECDKPDDGVLLFSTGSGPIAPSTFCRGILYPAMKRAGVERVGPTGEKRTWHSLRHTYARIALEHGAPLFWLS